MPLMKRPKGWYWGTQGPFKTKAQALAVARAAYAKGYREQQAQQTGSPDEPAYVYEQKIDLETEEQAEKFQQEMNELLNTIEAMMKNREKKPKRK